MVFDELSAQVMYQAVINGCYRLIEQREALNLINVFPVADHDTGDNMTSVCTAIIDCARVDELSFKVTLNSIARAAIIGSRGNSGLLLSQFFISFHQHCPAEKNLNYRDFCLTLQHISQDIDRVLSTPVEGTIITVIKQFAALVGGQTDQRSIASVVNQVMPVIKNVVEKTVSTTNGQTSTNIDAGALGFYYFLTGFADYLAHGISRRLVVSQDVYFEQPHEHSHHQPPKFRYCTEAILKNSLIDQQALLAQLTTQGDCAAVIGTQDLFKLHLHTNHPTLLFDSLFQQGTIKYPKVDDMSRQYQMKRAEKHSIALVTDSSADLPEALLDKYHIHIIPLNIHIGDHDLLDKYSVEPQSFYNQLQYFSTYPKTSCVHPDKIKKYLDSLSAHFDHILILSISSAMSGMYDAFVQASKKNDQVSVINTKTNAGAHGLLLDYAGQLIAKHTPFDVLIQLVNQAIDHTFIYVLINQFDAMIRSGRITKWSATLASWLQIKPIASINTLGQGIIAGQSLSILSGHRKIISLLAKQIKKLNKSIDAYSIVHADNAEGADQLAMRCTQYFNQPPLFIDAVSLAIGLHAGKGCVALAARLTV